MKKACVIHPWLKKIYHFIPYYLESIHTFLNLEIIFLRIKIKNDIRRTQVIPIRMKRATQRKVQVEVQYLPHYFKYEANIF